METDKKIERIKREIMGIVMAAKPSSQPNLINEQLERLDTEVQKAREEAYKKGYADGGLVYMGDTDMRTAKKIQEEAVRGLIEHLKGWKYGDGYVLGDYERGLGDGAEDIIKKADAYLQSLDKGDK